MRHTARLEPNRASVAGLRARVASSFSGPQWQPWMEGSASIDAALALSITVVCLLWGHDSSAPWRPFDATGYVLTATVNLLTFVRRRVPVTALALYCVLWFLYIRAGYSPVVNSFGAMLVGYTVAASRPRLVAMAGAAAGAGIWLYGGLLDPNSSTPFVVVQSIVLSAIVWKVGDCARELADRGTQLAVSAAQLRRDQEELARRAVIDEQLRIARELHDVVAHHLSVVSIQAGLARYVLESDPVTAGEALGTVLDTTGEALEELRRLLAVLRTGTQLAEDRSEAYRPAPGLGQLSELIGRMKAAGVPVEVRVTGTPRALPPGADLCAYRVIQECLTNVLKHAAGASAFVDLHYAAGALTVRIRDDGRGLPAGGAPSGGLTPTGKLTPTAGLTPAGKLTPAGRQGLGLAGMRERAKLYRGAVEAGPRVGGGWTVELMLPLPAAAKPAPPSAIVAEREDDREVVRR
ncbi:sensor histidine kinase [Rugosimonospora africana]|uniref:histidine kinase n=1 Tax=Rugosimonospora africana TaxID=556532 RepID=A0A8J3QXJ7_9ACTN|nr:histidine kinase [Rugosimonospora africana]GIH17663.1 ATPase [Rugosimonospora africana]